MSRRAPRTMLCDRPPAPPGPTRPDTRRSRARVRLCHRHGAGHLARCGTASSRCCRRPGCRSSTSHAWLGPAARRSRRRCTASSSGRCWRRVRPRWTGFSQRGMPGSHAGNRSVPSWSPICDNVQRIVTTRQPRPHPSTPSRATCRAMPTWGRPEGSPRPARARPGPLMAGMGSARASLTANTSKLLSVRRLTRSKARAPFDQNLQ